jgi:multiple antibiotic resistance protein
MHFLEYFIPLFVAIDPLGLAPLFVAVTGHLSAAQKRTVILEAAGTAFIICLGFMFLGRAIFHYLGITEADFRIAGGILLLVLAVMDLLRPGKPAVEQTEMIGIVPLATPLIAGPATLTTVLVLASGHGGHPTSYGLTSLSLALNLLLLVIILIASSRLSGRLSLNAMLAFSKLVMVLLAAIAVNFIRVGVMEVLGK